MLLTHKKIQDLEVDDTFYLGFRVWTATSQPKEVTDGQWAVDVCNHDGKTDVAVLCTDDTVELVPF